MSSENKGLPQSWSAPLFSHMQIVVVFSDAVAHMAQMLSSLQRIMLNIPPPTFMRKSI